MVGELGEFFVRDLGPASIDVGAPWNVSATGGRLAKRRAKYNNAGKALIIIRKIEGMEKGQGATGRVLVGCCLHHLGGIDASDGRR